MTGSSTDDTKQQQLWSSEVVSAPGVVLVAIDLSDESEAFWVIVECRGNSSAIGMHLIQFIILLIWPLLSIRIKRLWITNYVSSFETTNSSPFCGNASNFLGGSPLNQPTILSPRQAVSKYTLLAYPNSYSLLHIILDLLDQVQSFP